MIPIKKRISEEFDIPHRVDAVIDGMDNLEGRFILQEFSLRREIPYVFGAVEGYMGMVAFIDKTTKKLQDFLPKMPQKAPQVLGATAGMVASMQALEGIKYLSGRGDLLRNNLLIYDALSTSFLEVRL